MAEGGVKIVSHYTTNIIGSTYFVKWSVSIGHIKESKFQLIYCVCVLPKHHYFGHVFNLLLSSFVSL